MYLDLLMSGAPAGALISLTSLLALVAFHKQDRHELE